MQADRGKVRHHAIRKLSSSGHVEAAGDRETEPETTTVSWDISSEALAVSKKTVPEIDQEVPDPTGPREDASPPRHFINTSNASLPGFTQRQHTSDNRIYEANHGAPNESILDPMRTGISPAWEPPANGQPLDDVQEASLLRYYKEVLCHWVTSLRLILTVTY